MSGLDRPALQWTFVAIGVLLIAIAAAEAVAIRHARQQMEAVRAAEMNARLDRQQSGIQLTHERSTREALALEVARLRGSAGAANAEPPTLTLSPLVKRGAVPPEASVEEPPPHLPIQLRLLVPREMPAGVDRVVVAVRGWSTGRTIWLRGGLAPGTLDGRPTVSALVTGDVFRAGAYEIVVSADSQASPPLDIAAYEVTIAPQKR
ncbi:MAG TPA: hypothetical protein VF147_20045 [Vicinamibacterales bacterium]